MKVEIMPALGDLHRLLGKHGKYLARKPLMVPRVINNYVHLLLFRRPRLRAVEFSVTYRCNAACAHCSAAGLESDAGEELSPEEVADIVNQGRRLGLLNINFTGGEALLREDLEDMIAASRPRSAVVSVATNGLLFTPSRAGRLAAAGLSIVSISLDSDDPVVHDRFRGRRGTFRAAVRAVEIAKAFGIEPFLCTTVTAKTMRDGTTGRLVELARRLGVTITLQTACPVGRWAGNLDDLLGPDDRLMFHELTRQHHVRWEGSSNYLKEGCPAATEKLAITAYGDVMPCVFVHVSYGNLREEPLERVWRRMIERSPFHGTTPGCPVADDPGFREQWLPDPGRFESSPVDWRKLD